MDQNNDQKPEGESLPSNAILGKDELNLAEFPLCSIADRLQPNQKTLVFEDRTWDDSRGELIERQLIITGSEEFGLPTALDDEVLLGLIQLSKALGFCDRKVCFTRYQLIELLGWRNESKSYERLERSLNRWVGVTLYYKNAWRNRGDRCWADEKFHVLDNVTLFDREKAGRMAVGPRQAQLPLSSFTWNDVLFRSFEAGNLKSLDFDFFKSLEGAVAKRLYRFLDKRFFHRDRWEFDLKELSWEHTGLSRSYDVAGLKRMLRPAIAELERREFLSPILDEHRFRKVKSGQWRVLFERAKPKASAPKNDTNLTAEFEALLNALQDRGVTPTTAKETVSRFPTDRIKAQLEVFDWLTAQNDLRVSRNPAGFLVASIRSEYAPPKGFLTREEQEARQAKAAERKRRMEDIQREAEAKREAQVLRREAAIQQFWESLSEEERSRLEQDALRKAPALQRDIIDRGGVLAPAARKAILDAYAIAMMLVQH